MEITLNGNAAMIDEGSTLTTLIERLELGERRMAVEVNEEIVPRSEYGEFHLRDGDHVEIVHAVGGG